MAVQPHTLYNLGPLHPGKVETRAVKPSIARHVTIRVQDPLDHDAPAILHEPRSYSATEAKQAAVVLLHGTDDNVLSPTCSETLYREYGNGPRELKLLPGDDHGLTKHSPEVERMIFEFAAKTLGFEKLLDHTLSQAGEDLVESRDERIREMGEGHDLEGGERLQ